MRAEQAPSRSDGGDPAAIPNTRNGEATPCKPLKNVLKRAAKHQFPDFSNGFSTIQSFWTYIHAIHTRVTAESAIRVLQVIEPFISPFVAAIGDKTVSLQ